MNKKSEKLSNLKTNCTGSLKASQGFFNSAGTFQPPFNLKSVNLLPAEDANFQIT